MKILKAMAVALAVTAAAMVSAPVLAAHGGGHGGGGGWHGGGWHGGWHGHGSVGLGFYVGGPWYWYPPYYYPPYYYSYPPYYPPAVGVPASPPVYVEQGQAEPGSAGPSSPAQAYWYYCTESQAYYPYVKECAGQWQRVPPQPPS